MGSAGGGTEENVMSPQTVVTHLTPPLSPPVSLGLSEVCKSEMWFFVEHRGWAPSQKRGSRTGKFVLKVHLPAVSQRSHVRVSLLLLLGGLSFPFRKLNRVIWYFL